MDRAMSVEERIRRAEDIYNRRNGIHTKFNLDSNGTKINKKMKKKTIKKLLIQIFVCLLIYVIFYAITNREYIFSEEFRNSVNTFFTENVNVSEFYKKSKNFILNFFEDEEKIKENEKTENTTEENKENENKIEEKQSTEQKGEQEKTNENSKDGEDTQADEKDKEEKKDENIGGATEKTENISEKNNEKMTEQQIMEKEAKEIKKSISFIKPLNRKN